MPFNPKPEYTIVPDDISIKDFHDYKEDFVTCPPYQRKVVWSEYQADHVFPHSKGGKTILENGELLCRYHNQSKGAKIT